MADLRSIATAVEEYSIDNNLYPSTEGVVDEVIAIWEQVVPIYIRKLPTHDAWGHPILFWSTGRSYVILSPGSDGQPEKDLTTVTRAGEMFGPGGGVADPELDLIFSDGAFVQWPTRPTD
jgi:hypothetical protein